MELFILLKFLFITSIILRMDLGSKTALIFCMILIGYWVIVILFMLMCNCTCFVIT